MDVILKIDKSDAAILEELRAMPELEADEVNSAGFDGSADAISILLFLASPLLDEFVGILKRRFHSGQKVTIVLDGVVLTGTPEDIRQILQARLSASEVSETVLPSPVSPPSPSSDK